MTPTDDVRRQTFIVKSHQRFVVNQKIPAAGFLFKILNRVEHLPVTGDKRRLGPVIPFHQRSADEQIPTFRRIDFGVGNAALGNNIEAVKSDLLITHHLGPLLLPVWLKIMMLDDMPCQRLDPLRLNTGHHPCKDPTGLNNLGGHDPFWPGLGDLGAGKDQHFAVSCGQVFLLFNFHSHLTQKTCQYCLVQGFVTGRILVDRKLLLAADQGQLTMDIPPFPHSHPAEEVLLADLLELILGQLLALFFIEIPHVQQGDEIRFLVIERCMGLVSCLLFVLRPLTGVLNTQPRNNDQRF